MYGQRRLSWIKRSPRLFAALLNYTHKTALVLKKIFDKVQEILKQRGKPQKTKNDPQPFCGLLSCATCNMMITGEYKVKKQKNGNVHNYTYYRCTKKRKDFKCPEPCIRQEELEKQLSSLLQKFSLRPDWGGGVRTML